MPVYDIQHVLRCAVIKAVAAHRHHATAPERAGNAGLVVLEIVPLVSTEPANVAMGPEAIVTIRASSLLAGQQSGDDFFAVDDAVAVVPGSNVMDFNLSTSLAHIKVRNSRS